jgi:predicted dehydrogenase/threonine dehydrogenase-like Zn-dependent dehydrogenase
LKQILQDLGSGETLLAHVPAPGVATGALRIATRASLVSLGTERMLIEFGRANWFEKARQQPEKVKQVIAKIKTEGLWATFEAIQARLAEPIALGYCNAGVVLEVGAGVSGWRPGDRVLSNGPHAEVVVVPANLCAKIPDQVPDAHAPFAVAGAISLQGIRLLQPTLGEGFVVTGLGLLGLLAIQLLKAHGCRVLGVDYDSAKCALARQLGAETADLSKSEDLLVTARAFSGGRGVDGVLITAATKSSEPVAQAAHICRKRGRIVLVGVTGLDLKRADFYEKELSFQVSCSYGPGRYDPEYEDHGHDYPLPFVRWTEQRNFEAVLGQMAAGTVQVASLISHQFPFARALEAYAAMDTESALGLLLEYEGDPAAWQLPSTRQMAHSPARTAPAAVPVIAVLGAGNFAQRFLLPALAGAGPQRRKTVVSGAGVSAARAAKKFNFENSSTDASQVLGDAEVNTLLIATRHAAHARQVIAGLQAGKHVFVEKPLCLTLDELAEIKSALDSARTLLMVGFYRRFSPHIVKIKELLAGVRAPRAMIYTVNAGQVPSTHWVQDSAVGGGRIIGEACHFIDLLRFLAGAPIVSAQADFMGGAGDNLGDVANLNLRFADGSIGTIHYLANGHPHWPKERLEIFSAGRILQLDNFLTLNGWGWPNFRRQKIAHFEQAYAVELARFLEAVRTGGSSPTPLEEILEVSRVTIALAQDRGLTVT